MGLYNKEHIVLKTHLPNWNQLPNNLLCLIGEGIIFS